MVSMAKVTFTVDEETLETLRRISARMNKPQSAIFREAVQDYADRADKERNRLLAALDRMRARKPSRPQTEVEAEIGEIRAIRRLGGRRTASGL